MADSREAELKAVAMMEVFFRLDSALRTWKRVLEFEQSKILRSLCTASGGENLMALSVCPTSAFLLTGGASLGFTS